MNFFVPTNERVKGKKKYNDNDINHSYNPYNSPKEPGK